MKLKILRNLGTQSGFPPWLEHQEVDADDATAEALLKAGLAEKGSDAPLRTDGAPELRAVPPAEVPRAGRRGG